MSTSDYQSSEIDLEYTDLITKIEDKQKRIEFKLNKNKSRVYLFIILLTIMGTFQIALNFKLKKPYHQDGEYTIKRMMLDSETDTKKFSNMEELSEAFLKGIKNMAMISSTLFQIEADLTNSHLKTTYNLQLFKKMKEKTLNPNDHSRHMQTITFDKKTLQNLNKDNFKADSGLDFDIKDPNQFRSFLNEMYYMKAKTKNLILISLDNEASTLCENWTIDLVFNLNPKNQIELTRIAKHSRVECEPSWKNQVDYQRDTLDKESKLFHKEQYFFAFIALASYLYTFAFVFRHYLGLLEYNRLGGEKRLKQRWLKQRVNLQKANKIEVGPLKIEGGDKTSDLSRMKNLGMMASENLSKNSALVSNRQTDNLPDQKIELSTIILASSNAMLTLSTIMTILTLYFKNINDSDYLQARSTCLGLGCFLAWMNCLTIVSTIERLKVVSNSISKTFGIVVYLLAGVMPVFFGFMFAGYCAFHEIEQFQTILETTASLAAILAGDEILPFIQSIMGYGAIGFFYSMSFSVLFLICIHNIFIYVVGEAFKIEAMDFDKQEKKIRAEKNKLKKSQLASIIQQEQEFEMQELMALNSVISKDMFEPKKVASTQQETDKIKTQIFSNIIPQTKDKHIIEMTAQTRLIRDDLQFLDESLEILQKENVGSLSLTSREEDQNSSVLFCPPLHRFPAQKTHQTGQELHRQ